jgi:hypothetical protein
MKRMLFLLAMVSIAATSCNLQEPEPPSFSDITYYYETGAANDLRQGLLDEIAGAKKKIDFATHRLEDEEVAQALVSAHARGVAVRVVADSEAASDTGILTLQGNDVPVIFGDGEIKYLPDPTLTSLLEACFATERYRECTSGADNAMDAGLMVRPDDYNMMSDNFAVIDELEIWHLSAPVGTQNSFWFGWHAHSQDMAIAFTREFQQLAGGVFASTLTVYNGPVKSTVHGIVYDSRLSGERPGRTRQLQPGYLTDEGIVRIEFNPQQRLSKEIIDEIYRARGSVYLMTDQLLNGSVIKALSYKARAGFDVRVVVREGSPLLNNAQEFAALGDDLLRTVDTDYLPTVLVVDEEPDRNGDTWPRLAMVLSHSLMNVAPFQVLTPRDLQDPGLSDDVIRIYPSDLYVDGSMWTLREFNGQVREMAPITDLVAFWLTIWNNATPPT